MISYYTIDNRRGYLYYKELVVKFSLYRMKTIAHRINEKTIFVRIKKICIPVRFDRENIYTSLRI